MTLGGGWFFEIDAGDDRNLRRSIASDGHTCHSKIIHWHEFSSVSKYLRCWFPTLIIVLGTFNFARCCVRATVIRWQIPIFPLLSTPLALLLNSFFFLFFFLMSPISRVPRFSRSDEKSRDDFDEFFYLVTVDAFSHNRNHEWIIWNEPNL